MIVNQAFGSRMYPGQSILGRQVTVFDQEHTIVGVVGDARLGLSLWERPEPQMFFPVEQIKQDWRYVVIRAADPRAIAGGVRERVRELDPTLPLAELATLDQRVDRSMGPERFRGLLLGALGGFALVLSLIGIYSVVSYAANRRIQEIGIRLALGEGRSALRRRILRGAMGPAIAGTVLGAMAALGAGRWLQTFVLGVNPRDPTTLLAVAGLFLLVTALAAYGPARRASLLDPARTLRAE
jgi:predicted lysophospholipase L1 biosynthesis ABC-type transport system permease subunit